MNKNFSITKNKNFELELSKHTYGYHPWFNFQFSWTTRKTDHAGLQLTIEIWWYYLNMMIYDVRHGTNNYEKSDNKNG